MPSPATNSPLNRAGGALLLSFAAFAPISLQYRRSLSVQHLAGTVKKQFLVLGMGPAAQNFLRTYAASPNRQRLQMLNVRLPASELQPQPSASSLDDAEVFRRLDTFDPHTEGIIVAVPVNQLSAELRERLIRIHFQQTPVYTLDTFYETYWRRVPVFALDPSWPLQNGFQLARTSSYRHLKRLCDIVGAAVALILLGPVFLVIALLTRWDDGAPIIFRQNRVGRDGRIFTMFKFRSMRNRDPGHEGDLYTRTNDARITRVGKWLRKLRLDELPQLWNVLRGDMSLIGPRAEWTKCAEIYERRIPSYHFRHLVKPGITGWAQVNYAYGENEDDAIQKLKYDVYYVRRCSLRLDVMIVLKTFHVMLWGKGQ